MEADWYCSLTEHNITVLGEAGLALTGPGRVGSGWNCPALRLAPISDCRAGPHGRWDTQGAMKVLRPEGSLSVSQLDHCLGILPSSCAIL